MGERHPYRCPACGYLALVSGGDDCGFFVATRTVVCDRCAKILDVVADIRRDSPSYLRCGRFVLSAEEGMALYVPEGCAHGFLTLEDDTDVFYLVSTPHCPSSESGLRWDDPALRIELPFRPVLLSAKDASWPLVERP